MKLELIRDSSTSICTQGRLSLDGVFFCYTLELPVCDGLPGSAIPEGTYNVVEYASAKFGRNMPLLQDVPNRSEIEIHWGNTVADTDGCILIGMLRGADSIGRSRDAFEALWPKLIDSWQHRFVTLLTVTSCGSNNAEAVQDAVSGT